MVGSTGTDLLQKICLLKPKRKDVTLFVSTNFKTYVCVGIQSLELTQSKCLIDTRAGPNLVSKSSLHPSWTLRIKCQNVLKLGSADIQQISAE